MKHHDDFLLLLVMVKRLFKLTALLFLLISGFSASAKGGLYHYHHKNDKKATVYATVTHHNPLNIGFILNNPVIPVINVQQHRGAHTMQGFFVSPGFYTIGVKYLHFICGNGISQLSRFRKLILYPFHVFW